MGSQLDISRHFRHHHAQQCIMTSKGSSDLSPHRYRSWRTPGSQFSLQNRPTIPQILLVHALSIQARLAGNGKQIHHVLAGCALCYGSASYSSRLRARQRFPIFERWTGRLCKQRSGPKQNLPDRCHRTVPIDPQSSNLRE